MGFRPLFTAALAATALIVGVGVAPSAAALTVVETRTAAAAGFCTVTAKLPARIAIDRWNKIVPVTLSGCEGRLDWAYADLDGPAGSIDFLSWDGTRTEHANIYDWDVKPGVYRTIDGGGYTADYDSIGWKYTATTIKFASTMGITAKRTAGTATVSVLIKRYDAGSSRLIPYANRVVGIQSASSPHGPWTTVGYAKASAAGRATLNIRATGAKYYRGWTGDSGSFFGTTSPTIRV